MATEIKKVAVLGAGLMGTGIAAHLANAGIPSVLFDIVPNDAKESSNPSARNAFAIKALKGLAKAKPPQLMKKDLASLITPANYDDHGDLLADCDWIVEVVVERLDIKKHVFKWVAENRKPGSIVASNTSSIPLAQMAEGMPEEMRQNFVITHFFNPVRYMRLLELVDGPDTNPEVIQTLAKFGAEELGKGIVFAKDTPAFVGNRIGTYAIGSVFKHMAKHNMSIEAVDSIFGPAMGRPKTAVFKLGDLVGLDTLGHVFHVIHENCPDDAERDVFSVPPFLQKMIDAGATGRKAGAGFYKMVREGGKKNILVIDTETGEYREQDKPRFASVGAARKASGLNRKLQALVYGDDDAAKMAWDVTADLLNYSANRIPEIADDVWNIDNGMRWGFSWDVGPFESWDLIGVRKSVEKMEAEGRTVAPWVKAMLDAGRESFYERDGAGNLTMWKNGESVVIERAPKHLFLSDLKAANKRIENNVSAGLYDLGDGILGLEFHSKMNSLDEAIFDQYENALDKLDSGEFQGLVVGNQDGKAFCAGANILAILMGAMQGEFETIEKSILRLQTLMMRAKYSPNPVVTAPYGLTLGGGAEVAMHSSATVAAGELYMGLVEAGVGLIPAGGGTKELIFRALRDVPQDIDYDPNPFVQKVFQRIGLANVTSSGLDAQASGYLRRTDKVVMDIDALIGTAKQTALGLAVGGYTPPEKRTIKLPGPTGAAAIELFLYQMTEGGQASEHDALIGKKLAHILCGGDIPFGTARTEWDLLDLEREAFLSLCGEAKTQARMQAMLQTGKPLRN